MGADGAVVWSPRRAYGALAILTLTFSISFLDRQILSIMVEPIKAELGFSDSQIGLLTGFMFAAFYATLGVPIAAWADRGNRARIVALSCLVWSLFTAASGAASSFWHLALARLGVGMGEAGGTPPSLSIIADYFPPRRRAHAIALYMLGGPIGLVVGSSFAAYMAVNFGWRAAFLGAGAMGLVAAPLTLWIVREPKRGAMDDPGAAPEASPHAMPDRAALVRVSRLFATDRRLRRLLFAAAWSNFYGAALLAWTPAFLIRVMGLEMGQLGTRYAPVLGLVVTAGTLIGGTIVDRAGHARPRVYGYGPALCHLAALPIFLGGLASGDAAIAMVALATAIGLSTSYLGPTFGLLQNIVPGDLRSTASAVLLFVLSLFGAGVGPLLVGMISDLVSANGGLGLALGLVIAPAIAMAAWGNVATALSLPPDGEKTGSLS